MKIEVNVNKRYFFILLGVILLLGVAVYVRAAAVDTSQAYHALQQVAKSNSDTSSVDNDGNGIVDDSDRLGGRPVTDFCKSDNSNCPSQCSDFRMETTTVVVKRDNNDGGDPDCWIGAFGGSSCNAAWGDGLGVVPTQDYCARTSISYANLVGNGWKYYGFDVTQVYDSGNKFPAPGDACGSGDTRFDVLNVKFYRISALCPGAFDGKRVYFNETSLG